MKEYFPQRGDVVWLDYDPQRGHEQAGKRPAIVISSLDYNKKVGLALFYPITSQIKGYPFEVRITLSRIQGVILADQIKSLDWKARKAKYVETAPGSLLDEAREKLNWLLD
ncbi:MAG: endoribonuclease MazF [Spirochaetaceae bacterium]|nr:MAG: endoribonuclease MazF [Spirochaetaceae bacterium]